MNDQVPAYINILSGGLLLILSVSLWVYTGDFPQLEEGYPGPALFPRMIATGLGIAGLLILIQGFRAGRNPEKKSSEPSPEGTYHPYIRLIAGLAVVGSYPFLQPLIGFIPSLSIICLVLGWLMQVKLKVALPAAIAASLILYGIFYYLLGVSL